MNVRPAVLSVCLLVGACGSPTAAPSPAPAASDQEFFEERPVGSDKWTPIAAEPAWVKSPPPAEGKLRFVADGASNLRHLAVGKRWAGEDGAAKRVQAALGPVVGADEAARAAAAAKSKVAFVARACAESDGPNPSVPGNHFVQAWVLWEVSIDDVVAAVPAEKRDAARAALLAAR
jgi:hypothetical protein